MQIKSVEVDHNSNKIDITLIAAVLLLSTSAMDRIDFWSGHGLFVLTPSVIFSIIFFVLYLLKILCNKSKLIISKDLFEYMKILLLFNITIIISGIFSADIILSFKRIVQFALYSLCGFLAINEIYLTYKDKCTDIIVKCVYFQCYAYFVLFLLDEIMWLNPSMHTFLESQTSILDLSLYSYGPYIVRARGLNNDANRAGIFLVLCIFILIKFGRSSLFRNLTIILCNVMIIFTISRTAVLCLIVLLILSLVKYHSITRHSFIRNLIGFVVVIFAAIWIMKLPAIQNSLNILTMRFTNRHEESAVTHVDLIKFGIDEALSNFKYLLVGNGYGVSYTVLKNFFGNTKYANFHSGYITFLVECGIFSLAFFIYIVIKPLLTNRKCLPAVMVIAMANIPYQIHTEAYIWMFIPIFCLPLFEKNITKEQSL